MDFRTTMRDYLSNNVPWETILSSAEEFAEYLRENLSLMSQGINICDIADFHYALFKMGADKLEERHELDLNHTTAKDIENFHNCFCEHVNDELVEGGLPVDHPVAIRFPKIIE